jgi:sec-independent protein translocase protein TatA
MGRIFDSPWQLLILVLILVLLFGAKRLPDAARGLGRSLRILKSEVKEMQDDGKPATGTTTPAAATRPEPLEGRVVEPNSATTPSPQRRDV